MRKWCPESFDRTEEGSPQARAPGGLFVPVAHAAPPSEDNPGPGSSKFEKDSSLTCRNTLWELMSTQEMDQLLDRARGMLTAEFEAREGELRARHQNELDAMAADNLERLENWSREFSEGLDLERREIAGEAAGLALSLARKIIRDTVKEDPEFLARTIETALFKVRDSNPLTVIIHPDDADLLQNNPELMTRLRVGTVVPDRRVEKGGCRISAGVREWDATLSGQLEVLTAVVEEAVPPTCVAEPPQPGGSDEPDLD